jgi:hypothetical protein
VQQKVTGSYVTNRILIHNIIESNFNISWRMENGKWRGEKSKPKINVFVFGFPLSLPIGRQACSIIHYPNKRNRHGQNIIDQRILGFS